jgi:hypothetical protein
LQIEKVKRLLLEEKIDKGLLVTDHMYKHITDISDSLYILTNKKMHLTKSHNEIETSGYARSLEESTILLKKMSAHFKELGHKGAGKIFSLQAKNSAAQAQVIHDSIFRQQQLSEDIRFDNAGQ